MAIQMMHMTLSIDKVLPALRSIVNPKTQRDILRDDIVRDLKITPNSVHFTLVIQGNLPAYLENAQEHIATLLSEQEQRPINVVVEVETSMIDLGEDILSAGQGPAKPDFGRTCVLAVASGKGGVGKSTVSVNLAVALASQGYSVGLIDSDIYGPSIPTMFGIQEERPRVNEHRKIVPLERHNVKLLSMGFLTNADQAVIWRGPMVSNAVRQFLSDTDWGDLDYLLLDLPPGTGDIQLTITQTVSLTGAIIVTTPQKVALADARRGVAMFQNVEVPVLGIIENMAYFTPPELPEKKYYLFGKEGGRQLATTLDVPFLGEIPIEEDLRESCDNGRPFMSEPTGSVSSKAFQDLAQQTITQTSYYKASLPAQEKIEIVYKP